MTKAKVLIVDDEPDIRELLEITLSRMKLDTDSAENVTSAKVLLQENDYNLCLTDMRLPDGTGIDLVEYIQAQKPNTPVAVITAFGSMETAVASLKAGAFDFVSKPVDLNRLRDLVNTALKLEDSNKPKPLSAPLTDALIGETETIKHLRKQIIKLARSQAPVYISGESGAGKEIVAKQIHQFGPRNSQAFVAVNCGAIPSELMESEFFGHLKGSFTGANVDKEGLFQAAHGGTLFLDEVADLPLPMQVKLLRAIQEKSIRPVGSPKEIDIDVRILSATHKDLSKQVDEGAFRQDLFYRINVIQLNVPALRERAEDIPLLVQFFIAKICDNWGIDAPSLSPEAVTSLKEYHFPGNVRELENTLERALTLCDGDQIGLDHLQLPKNGTTPASLSTEEPLKTTTSDHPLVNEQTKSSEHLMPEGMALEDHLSEIEKQAILQALEETKWNRTAAAKKLGMSFRSLRYRLKKLGLDTD